MLAVAMAGANPKKQRNENDFYATPDAWAVVTALLRQDQPIRLYHGVWEPACGDGAMAEALKANGIDVIATDLIDRGYSKGGIDFLETKRPLRNAIITNPPFNLAEEFIRHAWINLKVYYLALLLKSTYFQASSRYRLFKECRPSAIYPLTWRLDWSGDGSPTMECAWFVWKYGMQFQETTYKPLLRPTELDLGEPL